MVWLLPLIGTGVVAGVGLLLRYPELYNYTQPITLENAEGHYRAGIQTLRWVRLVIACLLLYINSTIIQDAHTKHSSLQLWVILVAILLLQLPLFYYWFTKKRR